MFFDSGFGDEDKLCHAASSFGRLENNCEVVQCDNQQTTTQFLCQQKSLAEPIRKKEKKNKKTPRVSLVLQLICFLGFFSRSEEKVFGKRVAPPMTPPCSSHPSLLPVGGGGMELTVSLRGAHVKR